MENSLKIIRAKAYGVVENELSFLKLISGK